MSLLKNLQPPNDKGDANGYRVQRAFATERSIGAIKILELSPNADGLFSLKGCAQAQNDPSLFAVGKNRVDLLRPDIDARISLKP